MTQADKAALEQKLREAITKIDEVKATLENAEIEPEPKATGWAGKHDENYGRICSDGRFDVTYAGTGYEAFRKANKFTDDDAGRAKAEEINAVQLCYRLLKRFSDENGGEQIDWENHEQGKWYFVWDDKDKCFRPLLDMYTITPGRVYFISRKICQQAIDLFRPQIMAAMGV